MRIPLIDKLIDKHHASKPQKPKYRFIKTLEIVEGEKEATIDIPCPVSITNLEVKFPDGFRYIFGDEHKEGERKEKAKFKTCPSFTVSLPDVADEKLELPVEISLDESPRNAMFSDFGVGVLCLVMVMFVFRNAIFAETYISSILCFSGGVLMLFLAIFKLRSAQRIWCWWRKFKQTIQVIEEK